MRLDNDFASLSPEQQIQELARLLAAGVRRLRPARALMPVPEKEMESIADYLAISQEKVLSVHTG